MNSTSNATDFGMELAANYIYYICPPIFLLLGVPGNLVSMTIWLKRISTAPGSTCFFLAVMCATDTYVLAHGCLRIWVKALHGTYDLRHQLGCAAPLFIFTFLSDVSVWIIILLCIERTIYVWMPMNSKQLCRLRNGILALASVVFVFAVIHLHFFWTVTSESEDDEGICNAVNKNSKAFLDNIWPFIDFALYSFVPLALILILNMMILYRLRKSQSRLQQGQGRSSNTNRSGKILRTVVWMTISHFACTMPIVIYFLTSEYVCNAFNDSLCELIHVFCFMLQLTNHFTHFFIYSLTSTLFANDLARMFAGITCLGTLFRTPETDLHRRSKVAEEFEFRVNGTVESRLKSLNASFVEQAEQSNIKE